MNERLAAIGRELREHAPFTLFGALTGIVCMFLFRHAGDRVNLTLFQVFHPAHVFLSALVTVSLYKLRSGKTHLWLLIVIGYLGSIGVATLSDCVVPYFGDTILGVVVPTHSQQHVGHGPEEQEATAEVHDHATAHEGHDHGDEAHTDAHEEAIDLHDPTEGDEHAHEPVLDHTHQEEAAHLTAYPESEDAHDPADTHAGHDHGDYGGLHLGFIEDWYLVNPAAFLGILLAFWIPHEKLHTKLPHAGHVLISTWASSFYVLMNTQLEMGLVFFLGMFIVLFIAVWLPCCISDIVFPILFVGPGRVPHCCPLHKPRERTRDVS